METGAGRRDEYTHQGSSGTIIFTDTRHGIGCAKRKLTGYKDVSAGRDGQIQRAHSVVGDESLRQRHAVCIEHRNCVSAFATRSDARGQINRPV